MKCPNCGYKNLLEGHKDNNCDECGYKLLIPKVLQEYLMASLGQLCIN